MNCNKGWKLKKNCYITFDLTHPPPFITHYNIIQNYPPTPEALYNMCTTPNRDYNLINNAVIKFRLFVQISGTPVVAG